MTLRVERDGPLAILTLDRPDVLNAFNEALTTTLGEAVREVAGDPSVRAVAITGAGRAFSSGQDLGDRSKALARGDELRLGDELRRRYHPVIAAIHGMRKPVIAAINGVVAGAGLGLATACDIRVASASAKFSAAWSRVGLVPDAGSAYFLPRLVGWGRALDLVLTAESFDAQEALRIGLVTRVWPDAEFAAKWRDLALRLANGATEAYALTKEGMDAAWTHPFATFLDVESELQDAAGRSHDYREGVGAFLEKRPARFEGR